VVDARGAARDTPNYHEAVVHRLFGPRYSNGRKTVVTSNLTLADLAERFDPRLADRIREGTVLFSGANSRRQPRELAAEGVAP
jgi:hypothetical protein